VVCGVNTSGPGFSNADSQGRWTGLDVDFCKAVAAAVLSDANKVKFVPLNSQQRFSSLQAGEIDVLSRNSTWTLTRDASLGVVFTGINYFDGQGFMVPKKLKIDSAKKMNGATVCVQAGTTSEKNVADYFGANGMKYKSVVFDTAEAITSAFFAGRCQVYTTDMSDLAGARTKAPNARRLRDPAAGDLEGTARPVGAARRRRVVRDRALDPVRDDRGRGERPDAGQRRRAEDGQQGPGRAALPRRLRRHRQADRPRRGVGPSHRQAGRQLRRKLRAQPRPERRRWRCRAASTTCGPRAA
jgi:ABC-type amino acid transport substrate-binding protein